MKLWGGRFDKDTDALTDKLNASINFDSRLYREDIRGSIAHARMLGKQGIISASESGHLISELEAILKDIESGRIEFIQSDEDIHMAIENILTERIDDTGKRLHTARSRNDQVALDMRMYLKHETNDIISMLLDLLKVLSEKAKHNLDTMMPAYTHLQRAQPTTFAHYMMAYSNMIRRDISRLRDCYKRMDEMPLGSGALCSTTFPIDRHMVAEELGFSRITSNSLDAVSDRDFVIELLSCLSVLIMHLSRFSEEIVLWCSWEFRFVELDDAFSTGSSIMPQKKNPDIAELVRGKSGRIYGSLITLLTVMKGLPLAYNKDMQEDKEPVFDAVDTIKLVLPVFTRMIETMTVQAENMRIAAGRGFINATDCADYLVKKGVPFREAYTVIGKLVNSCIKNGKTLETLSLAEYQEASPRFEEDVYDSIKLEHCVESRMNEGGPSRNSVSEQISAIDEFIEGKNNET